MSPDTAALIAEGRMIGEQISDAGEPLCIELRDTIRRLCTALESAVEWKAAVEDAAVTEWTLTDGDTPRQAVNRLICCALDQERDDLRAQLNNAARREREAEREAARWAFMQGWMYAQDTPVGEVSIMDREVKIDRRYPTLPLPEEKAGSAASLDPNGDTVDHVTGLLLNANADGGKIIDLMDALKKSLADSRNGE